MIEKKLATGNRLDPKVREQDEVLDPSTLKRARIQICDDQEASVVLLERILKAAGYRNVAGTTDSSRVVELCAQSPPDIILLDLHMPHPDGFEVMRQVELFLEGPWLPIVVLTADTTPEAKQRALSAGARDFLNKPLDHTEVILRVHNLLEARFLHLEQRDYSGQLERTVKQRTSELEDARLEVLERLATASEYRDDGTGEHAQRVGRTSALILSALGRPPDEVELIRYAATIHDIGKIAVPDAILLKRGRLTPLEYEAMKAHVEVGRRILAGSRSPLLRLSEEIVVSHHEKWDGTGYPAGLTGDGIPLTGRAVAIADAFDAMTHERPYRPPWPLERALDEVRKQGGRHFCPEIAEVFMTLPHRTLAGPVKPTQRTGISPRASSA